MRVFISRRMHLFYRLRSYVPTPACIQYIQACILAEAGNSIIAAAANNILILVCTINAYVWKC